MLGQSVPEGNDCALEAFERDSLPFSYLPVTIERLTVHIACSPQSGTQFLHSHVTYTFQLCLSPAYDPAPTNVFSLTLPARASLSFLLSFPRLPLFSRWREGAVPESPKLSSKSPAHLLRNSPRPSPKPRPHSYAGTSGHDIVVVKEGSLDIQTVDTDEDLLKLQVSCLQIFFTMYLWQMTLFESVRQLVASASIF